jgi:membrane dipeptidase
MRQPHRFTALATVVACLIAPGAPAIADDAANLRHAHALLKSTPLVDGHNDLPIIIAENKAAPADVDGYDLNHAMPHETDIARMRKGRLTVQFWAAYVPGELKTGWARMGFEQVELTWRRLTAAAISAAPSSRGGSPR